MARTAQNLDVGGDGAMTGSSLRRISGPTAVVRVSTGSAASCVSSERKSMARSSGAGLRQRGEQGVGVAALRLVQAAAALRGRRHGIDILRCGMARAHRCEIGADDVEQIVDDAVGRRLRQRFPAA